MSYNFWDGDTMTAFVLGILDCDELAAPLKQEYHNYSHMFETLFSFATGIRYREYAVVEGELPQSVNECGAYLITGSKTGVYDDVHWLPGLRDFIQNAYARDTRLVGICFGHQLLADTLGGKAEVSSKGWGLGARTEHLLAGDDPLCPEVMRQNRHVRLLYSHQDQVVSLPPGATALYGSDFCPYAAFLIPEKVLAFQGHPEFTKAYLSRLMALREKQGRYRENDYQVALGTLNESVDSEKVSRWIVNFLRHGEVS